MTTLGINTVENITAVALIEDLNMLSGVYSTSRNKCASMLIPYIDYALKQSDRTLEDVDLISICSGPGSYTSLRIGYSTAKTLSIVNNIKLTEVSRFKLMAEKFLECSKVELNPENTNLIVVLPTTYRKVMSQTYKYNKKTSSLEDISSPSVDAIEKLLNDYDKQNTMVVGEFSKHKKASDFREVTNLENYFEYTDKGDSAIRVAQIGENMLLSMSNSDPLKAEPLYLISPF